MKRPNGCWIAFLIVLIWIGLGMLLGHWMGDSLRGGFVTHTWVGMFLVFVIAFIIGIIGMIDAL